MVLMLAGEGLSTRAIGSIVGASQRTVSNDIAAPEQNYSPEQKRSVAGLDGKTYTPRPVRVGVAKRRPLRGVRDGASVAAESFKD
jgi:hypothetical protein